MKAKQVFKLSIIIMVVISLFPAKLMAQGLRKNGKDLSFIVTTYDGLDLPARVINSDKHTKKTLLFINGSTPYDEIGNIGAFVNDEGKIITQPHDTYLRFIDIMATNGYPVVTMAKRSFTYPTKIPRPSITDLAMDINSLIEKLKETGILKNEKDLVIVGYSEGSIIASKVLPILKKQPYACILLGSASLEYDCQIKSIEDFYMTDVLRRLKNLTDDQIKTEMDRLCQIQKALQEMDEDEFETSYKKSKQFGSGFAMWESFYIDREIGFYDPLPGLLYANIPVLICIGENDMSMPVSLARKTYERLRKKGLDDITFRLIKGEVHQYEKYDVFAIIDTWLNSEFRSTDFVLQKSDSLIIEKYAESKKITAEISAIPYGGGYPDRIINCYKNAVETKISDEISWFNLGLKLFADSYNDEAFDAFTKSADPYFSLYFASLVWMGHIKDLKNDRQKAVEFYEKALTAYPGFPMQHDNWNMLIDKSWIEERIKVPFKGVK